MKSFDNQKFFWGIFVISLISISLVGYYSPIHQSLEYHHFSEQRTILGIPHFGDVITNLFFAIAGVLVWFKNKNNAEYYNGQKFIFNGFCLSAIALCLGSGYYHWNPNNYGLFWDRMTMLFGFTFIFIDTCIRYYILNHRYIVTKTFVLQFMFFCTLLPWVLFDRLEVYVLAQFFVMSVMPLLAIKDWFEHGEKNKHILLMFLFYTFAKIFESTDDSYLQLIYISGHSIKHICYAVALYYFGNGILKKAS